MPRISCLAIVAAAVVLSITISTRGATGPAGPEYEVVIERKRMIPMPDGVRLAADIYLPAKDGKAVPGRFPAVTSLVVYGRGIHYYEATGVYLAKRGFAFVSVDIRGDGDSEGKFLPFGESLARNGDLKDPGYDFYNVIEWIAAQPWCDGNVGTTGLSYGCYNQWYMLPQQPPHLKAAFMWMGSGNIYLDGLWYGGAGPSYNALVWSMEQAVGHLMRDGKREVAIKFDSWVKDRPKLVGTRPYLTNEYAAALFESAPWARDFVERTAFDEYWAARDMEDELDRVVTPCYVLEGWYDGHLRGAVKNFTALQHQGKHRLVIGPWMHGWEGLSRAGSMKFGLHAQLDVYDAMARWFEHWLKGVDNGIMAEPPVNLFVMGRNQWRRADRYPLPGMTYRKLYLHSNGSARGESTGGSLDFTMMNLLPGAKSDTYRSDPDKPVPNNGGVGNVPDQGVADQRRIVSRDDVLYYVSEPLEREMEVSGPVTATLHASSSAPDTDWIVMLCDVHPDGFIQNLTEGELRASLRESFREHKPLEPGKVYPFKIDLIHTSNCFKPGHRIGLVIRSSAFHRLAPNPQTGEPVTSSAAVIAENTIYHDWHRPSYVELPIVPMDESPNQGANP
ncbi:MAG: CocE/NonD family hydrolase [Planctomycetaceae bacterium]